MPVAEWSCTGDLPHLTHYCIVIAPRSNPQHGHFLLSCRCNNISSDAVSMFSVLFVTNDAAARS